MVVLTDDIAWLSPAGTGGVEVAGFPKPLHVPADLLDDVPADVARVAGDRDRFVVHGAVTPTSEPGPWSGSSSSSTARRPVGSLRSIPDRRWSRC